MEPDRLEREVNRRLPPQRREEYDYLDYDIPPPDPLTQATKTLARAIALDSRVRNYWGRRFYNLARVLVGIMTAGVVIGPSLVPRLLCVTLHICLNVESVPLPAPNSPTRPPAP